MIEDQVQEVLDLLNSELHGRVDYALFSKIFDAVGSIDIPKGYVVVPKEPTYEMQSAAWDAKAILNADVYKAMIESEK